MSFPNKLAAPAPIGSIAFSEDPPLAPVSQPGPVLMGASCCVSPGRDHDDGKKLKSEPLWASEELAGGGSEWCEGDAKRASSLDATECLGGITLDASLVRSSALEDLTAIDQAQMGEDIDAENDDANAKLRTQSLSDTGYVSEHIDTLEDGSAQLHEAQCDSPSVLLDNMTENSSADKESYSNLDFSNDSETVALESSEARHSSPARKSMVPVAVSKGLLEVPQHQGMPLLALFSLIWFYHLKQLFMQHLFRF